MSEESGAWWYERDGERVPGDSAQAIAEQISRGELSGDTLVWQDGWSEGRPANGVPDIQSLLTFMPSPAALEGGDTDDLEQALDAGPWTRYFARMVDFTWASTVAGFLIGVVLAIASPGSLTIFDTHPIVAGLLTVPFALLIDALVMGSFGNTPGKWLMGVRVRHANGLRMSVLEAIVRNMKLWVVGMGLGIPIVNIAAMIVAYQNLTSDEVLYWDKKPGLRVVVDKHPTWQFWIAVPIVIGTNALSIAAPLIFGQ